ncbi:MAG: DUF302 domain-containing protein [Anaerolineae bacterium]|nr:DUF302 domain-containing protein [Anaerolineae bacterium]NUQ06496.1 DUF302 domain-containing protein [Anaerolineae bacterium]
MIPANTSLGLTVVLKTDFKAAQERVTAALKAEGFGVLTEIDVKATLKQKLDVDFRPYKILGACNPPLAHRALLTAPEVGLLLPCNVTLSQMDDGRVQVSLIDPLVMMSVIANPELQAVADEARARLDRVVAALEA